jgi:hypothetical protein
VHSFLNLVQIRRVELARPLHPIAIREDHSVAIGYFSLGPIIPPTMNDARPTENAVSAPVPVIAESDVVDARDHEITLARKAEITYN